MTDEELFNTLKVHFFDTRNATLAYRKLGVGPKLLLIHGFPLYGYTWRKLLPELSKYFECYMVDLPGLGYSRWTNETDFDLRCQTERLRDFCRYLEFDKIRIVAHDSGASIARIMGVVEPSLISHMVLFNTEIPNHRPPWIPLYQKISRHSFMNPFFRFLIFSKLFRNSSMGFKAFYTNKKLLNKKEYVFPYINFFRNSSKKTFGALAYLKGINWDVIDEFEYSHRYITAKILFVWGEDDVTFPLVKLREMRYQFKCNNSVEVIRNASLLPQEEKSKQVNKLIIPFLKTAS